MRLILAITLCVFLLSQNTEAQDRKMIAVQLSNNQAELGIEHKILSEKLSAELYAGIANRDINKNFDDFTSSVGLGFEALSNSKNQISIHSGFGLYFTNNDYYSITVPLVFAGPRYTRLLGKPVNAEYLLTQLTDMGKRITKNSIHLTW